MFHNFSRLVAWLILVAIVLLTIVPAELRPTTPVPHDVEHAGIFFAEGIAFGIGYPRHDWLLSAAAILFCAAIELAQLAVPSRHARLSDFFVDTTASLGGILVASILVRQLLTQRATRSREP